MKIKKIFLFLLLITGLEILAVGKLPKNLFNSDKINILKRGILNGPINVYYPNGKIKINNFLSIIEELVFGNTIMKMAN